MLIKGGMKHYCNLRGTLKKAKLTTNCENEDLQATITIHKHFYMDRNKSFLEKIRIRNDYNMIFDFK
jgi:hypothetical protein